MNKLSGLIGMKKNRRDFIVGGLAGAALAGCGADTNGRMLLAADAHPKDYPTVQAVVKMGELLKQRSNGRFDIKMFAGGQLGSERDTIEITTFGGLDLNRVPIAPLNSVEPMTMVASLPFLFRSTNHMRRALDSDYGEEILAALKPHGLVGLCFYDSGVRSFYNTESPINSPEDMKGMKIRVQNSDLYIAMIKALGADAVPMSFGEVYQALSQGVIDGAENNWPSYHSTRHFEAAPYYSLSKHVMAPEILMMSLSRWEKLTKSDQALVKQAAKDSVHYMRELWDLRVENAKATLLSSGAKVNDISDLSLFSEKMRPVWERYMLSDQQKDLVKKIEAMEF